MSGPIAETLRGQPVLLVFLLIGLGYLIGKIRIGSFSFGPVAGVLFAGLTSAIGYQRTCSRSDSLCSSFPWATRRMP